MLHAVALVLSLSNVAAATPEPANCNRDAAQIYSVAPDFSGSSNFAIVRVRIDAKGHPIATELVNSNGNKRFNAAVMKAAMRSRYAPKLAHCEPVEGDYILRVTAQ